MDTTLKQGTAAELFVQYKMARWGFDSMKAPAHCQYDLVVIYEDAPLKVQVKSTQGVYTLQNNKGTGYRFLNLSITAKEETSGYKDGAYDILCLVAMDVERVIFLERPSWRTKIVSKDLFVPGAGIKTFKESANAALDKTKRSR